MSQPANDFPQLVPQLENRTFWTFLGFFGPGAIIACVTIGSGETVFASRGGAIYGYSMVWCFVAGALCKGVQLYSGSRFITLTGRGPLQSWMELPGPHGWFVWFIAIMTCIWMPFWLSGLPLMLGDFSNWVVGIPLPTRDSSPAEVGQYAQYGRWWGTMYIVVAILITWLQSYNFLERVQTIIVGLLLFCMLLAAIVSRPDWLAMLVGGFVPELPAYEPWVTQKYPELVGRSPWVEIMVYIGAVGGGTQDYLGYIGMLREKAWGMLGWPGKSQVGPPEPINEQPENIARGKRWLLAPQADVIISFAAILIFTVCFVALGAAILHKHEIIPNKFSLLVEQSIFLRQLAGGSPALQWCVDWAYRTGIFFAFFGTILGAYELFTRTIYECAIALFPQWERVPLKRYRFWTLVYVGLGGLILLWGLGAIGFDPVKIVTPAALVGSVLTCGLWCFAMLWSDRVHLPKALQMGWLLRLAVFISGTLLTAGAIVGIYEYLKKLIFGA